MNREGAGSSTALFEFFADEYSREILLAADEEPRTAKELSRICDASLTTIYRRISALQEYGAVAVHSTIGSGGEHKKRFETTIEGFQVTLADGDLEVAVERHDELADSFASLWAEFRDEP